MRDQEADELIKIMLDTRRASALDDPNRPNPEVAAKLAEFQARERQINAAADARAAGTVGTYGLGMADVPLYGTGGGRVVVDQTAYDAGLVTRFPRDLEVKRFG